MFLASEVKQISNFYGYFLSLQFKNSDNSKFGRKNLKWLNLELASSSACAAMYFFKPIRLYMCPLEGTVPRVTSITITQCHRATEMCTKRIKTGFRIRIHFLRIRIRIRIQRIRMEANTDPDPDPDPDPIRIQRFNSQKLKKNNS
jgi:hypothetical protein